MNLKASETSHTRLSGRRLMLARTAWMVLSLVFGFVFSISTLIWHKGMLQDPYQLQSSLDQIGLSVAFFAFYATILDTLLALALIAISLVIYWRKSDDWMGLLVSLSLLAILPSTPPVVHALPGLDPVWYYPILVLRIVGAAFALLVYYLFPDGHFVPSWTSWLAVIYLAYLTAWILFPSLVPPATPVETHNTTQALSELILLFWVSTGVFSLLYRYRRVSNLLQQQQTKWVMFGFMAIFVIVLFAISLVIFIPGLQHPGAAQTVFLLFEIPLILFAIFLLPLSIGLSILRYHLWDIDILIRRTLVYSILTVLLGLSYFAGVTLLQAVAQAISHQRSPASIVVVTLAIAALFTPLRRRIQEFIDRRFYRQKYDSEKALAAFAATARSETDLEMLTRSVLSTVHATLQPESAALWMKSGGNAQADKVEGNSR